MTDLKLRGAAGLIAAALIGCASPANPTPVPSITPSLTSAPPLEQTTAAAEPSQPGVTVSTVSPPLAPTIDVGGSGNVVAGGSVEVGPAVTGLPSNQPTATPMIVYPPPPGETLTITLANDRGTVALRVGQEFLLNLNQDPNQTQWMWSVDIENQSVVSRVMNLMPIKGAQGVFKAVAPGQTALTATGTMVCQPPGAPCPALARLFQVQIVVQP